MRYKTKIVELEAYEFTGDKSAVLAHFDKGLYAGTYPYCTDEGLFIHTLEGAMRVTVGDFIVTGLRGELYACKPDVFHMKYEKVGA